ncbi:2-isopropylmalate synthase [Treponema primitia ZAS-2]|uniref:2-isopropylmalate synthase n=1 Tax=Treponema primitia (strain ATCC BAA-887 / DSM 12427 / ZAS-2) TaxID=545694 RepID=F5YHU1_TREPZ|nr:2-isopropylmalate synthase [Treponema primitia]AEF84646.1 2-isopropylmalate synthase [Treponema primitia ZAS-2]
MSNTTKRIVKIFDTTLRDGEQSPGCSMNIQEKLEVAKKLEKLGVDIIEAGFPASSPGDLESVKTIAGIIRDCTVAGLCRSLEKDIDAAREALAGAAHPRIHIFLATSPVHMEYKLKLSPEQVLAQAVAAVKYAGKFCKDIEFSAEDAFRSDPDFVCKVFGAVIAAGATTVNHPDTVGYAMPDEFGARIRYIKEHTPGMEKAALSVHCHNDLGLAVANSLAAIANGADQAECTVNGIGERAGNASLEEIVMGLRVRKDYLNADTRIDATQIYTASRLVTQVTGVKVQPNKAIVGDNAFAHEAGIHQHGVMANRETYEIMTPESIGIPKNRMVLGKHSGRHAFEERLNDMGYTVDGETLESIFAEFKILADKKKVVSDRDIEALVMGVSASAPETWKLEHWAINTGSALGATGIIKLLHKDGEARKQVSVGDGPVDAIFTAINEIVGKKPELELYEIGSITDGSASQGETMVKIAWEGRHWNGRGVSTDVLESSIKAYLSAINAMEWDLAAGISKSPLREPLKEA